MKHPSPIRFWAVLALCVSALLCLRCEEPPAPVDASDASDNVSPAPAPPTQLGAFIPKIAVDLAGGSGIVTGVLPAANQAAQTMAGDVTGTTAAAVVAKANGATIPAAGSLVTGTVLRATGASALGYGAVDLANASAVTGTLPAGNQAAQTVGGDLSGTTSSATVAKVNGATYPAAGSLTTGTIPRVTGASAVAYGALDLANASAVTGTLPAGNQAAQTVGGDLSGTTSSATVAKVNGATYPAAGSLTTGTIPRVTGASAVAYGALDLANASAVTGTLPTGNQASQAMGGSCGGTTASATVLQIDGSGGTCTLGTNAAIMSWASGAASPTLKQADLTTNSGTGAALTVQAQNETGTTSTGGPLNLTSGTGTTAAGAVNVQTGGTTQAKFAPGNNGDTTLGTAGILNFPGGTTTQVSIRNHANSANLTAISTNTSDQVFYGLGSGTGAPATVIVAASSGIQYRSAAHNIMNASGGANYLVLSSTEITTTDSLVVGLFTQAMADAPQTVSAANSVANTIIATGANTAVRALTLTTTPTAGKIKFVRNNCTGNGITVQFSSGTATGTIAPATSAVVVGDGTNAVVLMTGT